MLDRIEPLSVIRAPSFRVSKHTTTSLTRGGDVPRSSFYAAQQAGAADAGPKPSPARRGPKPAISDEDLLAAIRADLVRSPWTGEGHRKVWARLSNSHWPYRRTGIIV